MRFVVSTKELEPSDRFEFWCDLLTEQTFESPDLKAVAALPPVRARSQFAESFDATLHAAATHAMNLVVTENDAMDIARTRAMIRSCDSDVFYLTVNYRGLQQFVLERDVVELRPSDMVLLHSSMPLYSRSDPGQRRQRGAMVLVDPGGVPGGRQRLGQLLGRPLSSQDSLVSLVAQHLYLLGTSNYHPDDDEQLSSLTSSLIALMLARQLGTDGGLPGEIRADSLFARMRSYILARLTDPDLGAETVAAAHHISTRTLHRVFQARGLAVASWIREQRMERCRGDLLDPAFADQPIRLIARRWGFTDASQFSRAYRARYGESPATERGRRS